MNTYSLMMGIIPLLAFVIIDSFLGIRAAIVTTVIMAFAEAIYTWYEFGELDFVTGFTLLTVILLAGVTYFKRKSIFIKFQPVLLSAVMGIALLVSHMMGKPYLVEFAIKYQEYLPEPFKTMIANENPGLIRMLALSTSSYGVALCLHAVATAWAALKLSNWWWIAIRGIGFYLFAFAATLATRMFM